MTTHYNNDKLITCIIHNWFYTPDGDHDETFTVGTRNVTAIKEHQAQGEGDRWFYDVFYADWDCYKVVQSKFSKVHNRECYRANIVYPRRINSR